MATWEDGPEYAPLQRPDAFAEPDVATSGLQSPPPPPILPPAPAERPVFDDPTQPVPPLHTLVPAPPAGRDPEQPFDVVASLMTSESSAWASAHWTGRQSGSPAGAPTEAPAAATPAMPYANGGGFPTYPHPTGSTGNGSSASPTQSPGNGRRSELPTTTSFPPPTGFPGSPAPPNYPPPNQPFPPPGYPPPGPGQFPAPGTPQWFTPGGYPPPPPPPAKPNARAVLAAATPGVLVTLAVGALIWVLAPVTVIVGFLLTSRMTHGRKPTRTAFAAVLAFLGLVGLLSLVTADGLFADWWDSVAGWACFGSWVLLVVTVVAVYRALKLGSPDPPPTPRVSLR
ncbi:MAG TPA: hypothetical protein VFU98_04145 [Microlunatus sp.]|nr:hypothetical protein [Microlunatus sp.]